MDSPVVHKLTNSKNSNRMENEMTNIDNLFDDPLMKAANLDGKDAIVTVAGFSTAEVGQDREQVPTILFEEFEKAMVLNKTNANMIKAIFESEPGKSDVDTEDIIGKRVTLYPTNTDYEGRMVPCIRIRGTLPK